MTQGIFEQKLVHAQAGNREAFAEVYDEFVKKLYNYAFFRLKDKEAAEDVVSDTFMKALEHLSSFNPNKGNAASWLYRIARNTLIDYTRKRGKTMNFPEDFDVEDTESLKKNIENKDMLERITKTLDTLSEKEREIIMLRVWDELSYKEIAEVLGKSEASLKMAASRALKSLRSQLPLGVYILLLLSISGKL